jgi:hypothetical protein
MARQTPVKAHAVYASAAPEAIADADLAGCAVSSSSGIAAPHASGPGTVMVLDEIQSRRSHSTLILAFVPEGAGGRIDLAHLDVPAHDH